MSRDQLVDQFEATNNSNKRKDFKVGDTVKVSTKIVEGQKERIQVFTGIVIGRKGIGSSESFSVYRNAYGCCMERVFLLNSPRVTDIEVIRHGDVCKSKLYHLRGKTGKKAKVKEKIGVIKKKKKVAPVKEPKIEKTAEKPAEQPTELKTDTPTEQKAEQPAEVKDIKKEENK